MNAVGDCIEPKSKAATHSMSGEQQEANSIAESNDNAGADFSGEGAEGTPQAGTAGAVEGKSIMLAYT